MGIPKEIITDFSCMYINGVPLSFAYCPAKLLFVTMRVMLSQPPNVQSPMLVTLGGFAALVKLLQPQNAPDSHFCTHSALSA